jgi:hypothetical protein
MASRTARLDLSWVAIFLALLHTAASAIESKACDDFPDAKGAVQRFAKMLTFQTT